MPATLDRDELPEGVSCADPEGWVDTRPADAPSRVFDDREPLGARKDGDCKECEAGPWTPCQHDASDPSYNAVQEQKPTALDYVTDAPFDAVKNPPHYSQFAIQPIMFTMKNNLGFAAGNVVKYVCRYELKDGLQDLEKAREYIDIMIADYKERNPT